jgi:signal transduction histidine kinase
MSRTAEQSVSHRVTVQERLRRQIAAHLHGPVQGRLLALKAQLDELLRSDGIPPQASVDLRSVADEMGRVIQRDIARLSRRLYPSIVRRGLIPCLQSLVDEYEPLLDLRLRLADDLLRRESAYHGLLSEKARLMAYRIVEEALNNVLKHARSSHVSLEAGFACPELVSVSVRDDGPGFDPCAVEGGLGLAAIQDFAAAAGARLSLTSSPGNGTAIEVLLPVARAT